MFNLKRSLFSKSEVAQEELLHRFKQYYLKERDFVRSSIYWMLNSDEVDDLVQETFVKGWKGFAHFKEQSSFRTWIYRIAMNVTYDYLKKHKVDSRQVDEEAGLVSEEELELKDLISKGMMTLSQEQREAFSLHYQLGLTYEEASKLTGVPEGTIKSRAHHGKTAFVKFLQQNGVRDE